jgi:hypothetical protein
LSGKSFLIAKASTITDSDKLARLRYIDGINAFNGCTSLKEVHFMMISRLKTFCGFQNCTSLSRIEIPPSVKVIDAQPF